MGKKITTSPSGRHLGQINSLLQPDRKKYSNKKRTRNRGTQWCFISDLVMKIVESIATECIIKRPKGAKHETFIMMGLVDDKLYYTN